jgi:hypothetical protein
MGTRFVHALTLLAMLVLPAGAAWGRGGVRTREPSTDPAHATVSVPTESELRGGATLVPLDSHFVILETNAALHVYRIAFEQDSTVALFADYRNSFGDGGLYVSQLSADSLASIKCSRCTSRRAVSPTGIGKMNPRFFNAVLSDYQAGKRRVAKHNSWLIPAFIIGM